MKYNILYKTVMAICIIMIGVCCNNGKEKYNGDTDNDTENIIDDSRSDDTNYDDSEEDDDSVADDDTSEIFYFAPSPTNAIGIFVSIEGDDLNSGSMEAPVQTINKANQLGLQSGKSIFASQGNYHESINISVSLYGGYNRNTWKRDLNEYKCAIYSTRESAITVENNAELIIIEGFQIYGLQSENENVMTKTNGIHGKNCELIIANNYIDGGVSSDETIGAIMEECSIIAYNNTIFGQQYGGVDDAKETIGVLVRTHSAAFIANNIINSTFEGYAVTNTGINIIENSTAFLINNIISGGKSMGINSVTTGISIGYIYEDLNKTHVINNIIMSGNGQFIAAAILDMSVNAVYRNNDMYDLFQKCFIIFPNFPDVGNDICIKSIRIFNALFGNNNIDSDPEFEDYENNNYLLTPQSPCIDAGNAASDLILEFEIWFNRSIEEMILYDRLGNIRPYGSAWDIGPYEWRP
jgi:hypothetical protein